MSFGVQQGLTPPSVGRIESKEDLWRALKKRWAWEKRVKEQTVIAYERDRANRIRRKYGIKTSET